MESLWLQDTRSPGYTSEIREADVVVVGAGLTGMLTAWRILAEGHRVLVLEAAGRHRHFWAHHRQDHQPARALLPPADRASRRRRGARLRRLESVGRGRLPRAGRGARSPLPPGDAVRLRLHGRRSGIAGGRARCCPRSGAARRPRAGPDEFPPGARVPRPGPVPPARVSAGPGREVRGGRRAAGRECPSHRDRAGRRPEPGGDEPRLVPRGERGARDALPALRSLPLLSAPQTRAALRHGLPRSPGPVRGHVHRHERSLVPLPRRPPRGRRGERGDGPCRQCLREARASGA
ncbi:MAG: FAD-dependent oxidoreductase [Acidobacteria bacterium]|nr:MAG: FAD-dependent oxidoreductase [Acidobacteriota bacterium]REK03349.1 MAG: FAD-dependent oxidoreductase [Acidobacteriota bacterium]